MDVKTQSDGTPTFSGAQAAENEGEEQGESLLSFLWFLAKVLAVVLVFRIAVFSPFSIPTESMVPLLWKGDYLIAQKWSYGYSRYSVPFNLPLIPTRVLASEPERGDVVIFKHPIDESDYIKRVIGLPGDTIALEDGIVILNGERLAREKLSDFVMPLSPNTECAWGGTKSSDPEGNRFCSYPRYRETLPGGTSYDILDVGTTTADTYGPKIIPEGHLFLMGDNRDRSSDSRFEARAGEGVGIVSQDLLVGEASFIIWSTDGSASWVNPVSWFTAARWNRIGNGL